MPIRKYKDISAALEGLPSKKTKAEYAWLQTLNPFTMPQRARETFKGAVEIYSLYREREFFFAFAKAKALGFDWLAKHLY